MKQRTLSQWSHLRQRLRPRLLIEEPHPALRRAEFRRFEDAGFRVALCSGLCDEHPCPLVEGSDCRPAELADVAAAHRRRRPDLPIVVQIPRRDPTRCPPGCLPDHVPASVDGQIRALWRALDRRPAV
jgi:hypothetical protein